MTEPKVNKRSQAAGKTINAYRRLFSTEDGKLVLEDLMKSNFLGRTAIGNDTHHTYYNEGARDLVLRILHTCNLQEKQIEMMINEMNKQTDEYLS